MATEWRQVQSHYWPKWLIGRLIRPKEVAPFGGTVRLKPDGQQSSNHHKPRQAVRTHVSERTIKQAAAESGLTNSCCSLLVLGYDGKVGKRRPGPRTAKVKVVIGDRIWWIVDVKPEQFEYMFMSGLPDDSDSDIPAQEETT